MWRCFSGLPRAIRQHFHGPRASATGAVREDEVEQCKDVPKKRSLFDQNNLRLFAYSHGFEEDRSKHGPDQDKWYKSYTKDFYSFLNGNHNALEALGWGAAVILGIHLSKCPIQRDGKHRRKRSTDASQRCILWQVALTIPDKLRTTTSKSVVRSVTDCEIKSGITSVTCKEPEKHTETVLNKQKNDIDDPLYKVMDEFEDICKKYTAIGKNMQGLQQAAKSHMTKAVSSWIDASHLGYTKAQFNLGLCYETGQGVKKNLQKAAKYYKLAAEDNHPQALYNLALIYLKGEGDIQKNVQLALELLHKSAEHGLGQAQTYLGVYYTEEENQDLEKAVSFFKAAAQQSDPEAQYFLGVCYEQGWGVEINECKSAELYAQAASSGHDGALYSLAYFNQHSLGGLPEDKVISAELYEKAAAAGNEEAKFQLDKIRAESAVEEYRCLYPNEDDDKTFVQFYQKDQVKEEEKDGKSIKLNVSISSPTLTDYIRNHLSSFTSSTEEIPYNFRAPFFPANTTSSVDLPQLLQNFVALNPNQDKSSNAVSFDIGADEDDLHGLYSLDSSLDSVTEHPQQIHHFCSFIQKNSTMPDLHCVSCN